MRTRFLTLDQLDQRDERAWRRLADRSAEANPFFEPEFVLPAARHLGLRGGGLLVAEEGTEWVACLPVSQRATKLQVPVLAGWRTPYSFLGTPLVAEGAERVLPRLVSEVQRGRLSGVTMLDQISRESVAWQAMEDGIGRGELVAVARRDFDRAAFAPEGDNPQLPLSSRRRADLRRTRRRLEELLGGDVELVQVDSAGGGVDEFLALEASGWKGDAGTALSASASHARFFADLCRGFARQGRLEMMALRCAGRTLAMATLLAARNSRYAFKMAFDEEFRKQAPGAQLIVEFTEHPRDGGAHYMDSCADPDNEIMNRLWPDRRALVSVALARPGVRAGVLKRALRIAGQGPAVVDAQPPATEVATR
jgi:CelD/BcsL family acetyltransferase involved in cellulose biosynthesis